MAALIPDVGLIEVIGLLVNQVTMTDDLYLHLYGAAHTPALGDVLADYTAIEVSSGATGFSPVDLTPSSWFLNVTTGTVSLLYPPVTCSFPTGGATVHGYFLTHGLSGELIAAEEAATPVVVAMGGDVTVSVQLQTKNCP